MAGLSFDETAFLIAMGYGGFKLDNLVASEPIEMSFQAIGKAFSYGPSRPKRKKIRLQKKFDKRMRRTYRIEIVNCLSSI